MWAMLVILDILIILDRKYSCTILGLIPILDLLASKVAAGDHFDLNSLVALAPVEMVMGMEVAWDYRTHMYTLGPRLHSILR